LNIKTGNDAFENDKQRVEVCRILRKIADNLDSNPFYGDLVNTVRDINGNDIGRVGFIKTEGLTPEYFMRIFGFTL